MSDSPDSPGPHPPAEKPIYWRNWVTFAGMTLAVASFFAAAFLIAMDLFRGLHNPYVGILTYIVAPGFLLLGLLVFVAGLLWERRRARKQRRAGVAPSPRLDFNLPHQRHVLLLVVLVATVLLLMTAVGSYHTYEFTESVMFCGLTCHSVMQPEYTAYQESPHARVACVKCHIGPGATWFVKSKLSGAYQVYATLADVYPRPIPSPIKDLRPAQQTCDQCHWPRKFYSAVERVRHHYLPDEKNSPWTIRMLVKIGGGDPSFGPVGGIHWHMNIDNRLEYIARDPQRQDIPWVRVTDRQGHETVYQSSDSPLSPVRIAASKPRVMDCIDCHNRPTHVFHTPVDAVNLAMSTGRIDPAIPDIKRQAVAALTAGYASEPDARRKIAATLQSFYRDRYGDYASRNGDRLAAGIGEVQQIYSHNFFPDMKVSWQTYPDNIGHKDDPGCFRCHDGQHVSADGRTVPHACDTCHTIIAQGRGEQATTIAGEGLAFEHPVDTGGAWRESPCTDCHDGSLAD